jgi:hypothetical protein
MKKLIIVFGFILLGFVGNAQLFFTIDPAFFSPGLLYNYSFEKFGIYTQARYGNITQTSEYEYFHTQSIKVGAGISIPVTYEKDIKIYVGYKHSYFYDTKNASIGNVNRIKKNCFDVGVSGKVSDKVSILLMTDFLNWESLIGVTYKF